jgi:hypothetical protein
VIRESRGAGSWPTRGEARYIERDILKNIGLAKTNSIRHCGSLDFADGIIVFLQSSDVAEAMVSNGRGRSHDEQPSLHRDNNQIQTFRVRNCERRKGVTRLS